MPDNPLDVLTDPTLTNGERLKTFLTTHMGTDSSWKYMVCPSNKEHTHVLDPGSGLSVKTSRHTVTLEVYGQDVVCSLYYAVVTALSLIVVELDVHSQVL